MLIREMVPSNTSCLARGQVPFSLLMRTRAIFMLPKGWIGRNRPTTRSELKHWTDSPTNPWSLNRNLSSKFKISMIMNPNFWTDHTQQEFLKCLQWVSRKLGVLACNEYQICSSLYLNVNCQQVQRKKITSYMHGIGQDEGEIWDMLAVTHSFNTSFYLYKN